jgi:hypothetical protein
MADVEAPGYTDHSHLTALAAGLLLPPLAWLLDMQVSYSLVKWACANDRQWILFAMPLCSLTLTAATTLMSWQTLRQTTHSASDEGGRPIDRSHLLAVSGLAMSILFGLLILVSLVPRALLSPCE